jgi:hypothetical protein
VTGNKEGLLSRSRYLPTPSTDHRGIKKDCLLRKDTCTDQYIQSTQRTEILYYHIEHLHQMSRLINDVITSSVLDDQHDCLTTVIRSACFTSDVKKKNLHPPPTPLYLCVFDTRVSSTPSPLPLPGLDTTFPRST